MGWITGGFPVMLLFAPVRPPSRSRSYPIDDTISEPDETALLLSLDPNYIAGSCNPTTVTIHSNE